MNANVIQKILDFRDKRDWKEFHNAKDLAISISLEASELLECFQWKSADEALKIKHKEIEEEIADIAIYTLMLCDVLDLDITDIIEKKLLLNEVKYPVSKSKGKAKKYDEL